MKSNKQLLKVYVPLIDQVPSPLTLCSAVPVTIVRVQSTIKPIDLKASSNYENTSVSQSESNKICNIHEETLATSLQTNNCSCSYKVSELRERANKVKEEGEVKLLQFKHQERLNDVNNLESYKK